MPAKSKSQQRLFGMVHAYNKGEFHGSRSLRNRIAALSRHISDTDAQHFAKTPHEGLPEKKAQVVVLPETVVDAYRRIPQEAYAGLIPERSKQRRSILSSAWEGAKLGGLVGGIGLGAAALGLNMRARKFPDTAPRAQAIGYAGAGLHGGLHGLAGGAVLGAALGAGANIFNRLKGDEA